jgi:crotonobetainyl-CoA:carnitine CoA-transferase CaiB-like acyl-CoA transferase
MFENIKVVELASVLAGPMVGSFFAELGAEVTKIENAVTNGDVTRTWKLASESKESPISGYYSSVNYGKKILFKDFSRSEDYTDVVNLIKESDILIVNFKPGDAEKLRLDYETIQAINSSIIYAEITGFESGNQRVAYDVVLQAECGYMYMNGERNAKPLKMPIAMIDILAAHQLKEGILCAYIDKLKSGKGSKVSVSLYAAAISSLVNQATNWLMSDIIPEANGSLHPNIAPYGDMFQTEDMKWIVLAVGSDKQFFNLCQILEIDINDERFSTNQLRLKNRTELEQILAKKMNKKMSTEWQELLLANQIPHGLVKNMKEVFDSPIAQNLILGEIQDGIETKRVKTVVFQID